MKSEKDVKKEIKSIHRHHRRQVDQIAGRGKKKKKTYGNK